MKIIDNEDKVLQHVFEHLEEADSKKEAIDILRQFAYATARTTLISIKKNMGKHIESLDGEMIADINL